MGQIIFHISCVWAEVVKYNPNPPWLSLGRNINAESGRILLIDFLT